MLALTCRCQPFSELCFSTNTSAEQAIHEFRTEPCKCAELRKLNLTIGATHTASEEESFLRWLSAVEAIARRTRRSISLWICPL